MPDVDAKPTADPAIASAALEELAFVLHTGSDPGPDAIEALLGRLAANADATVLPGIFGLLDDDDASGLLWPVFYVAEDQGDAYLRALLAALPHLLERAPSWAETAVLRIINTRDEPEDCTARFDQLAAASSVRARRALARILKTITRASDSELAPLQRDTIARTAAAIDTTLH
jgi:hypothetical protein